MKKNIVSLLVFVLMAIGFSQAKAQAKYVIQPVYIVGPNKTSPDFGWWASNAVRYAYLNLGFRAHSTGFTLTADKVSQAVNVEDRSGSTLWLAVRVTGVGGAKVSLSQLHFEQHSNDLDRDSLKSEYTPGTTSVYGNNALGVNWSGKSRENDIIVPAGTLGTTPADEIVFIGMQSTFFVFDMNDPDGYAAIERYIAWFADLRLTGTVKVMNGTEVLATANRTMSTHPLISTSSLSVRRVGDGDRLAVTLADGPDTQTRILQSAPNANGPWSMESNILLGESVTFPASGVKFFRTLLE